MNQTTIGILAGMGPRSTAPFVDMVVSECQAHYGATYDEEYPPMMIYTVPVRFRADEPADWAYLREVICAGLKRLEATGVDFIAMPCNTAHVIYDDLKKCTRVPLLNMIDETLVALPPSARKVVVLATRMTVEARLYHRGLEHAGIDIFEQAHWQDRVDNLISRIKTSPDLAASQLQWDEIVSDVAAAGAETILLGCTDFNAINPRVPAGVTLLDATRCLARAVVRRYVSAQP